MKLIDMFSSSAVMRPAALEYRSVTGVGLAIVAASMVLTLSSYLAVPMVPVPMTMQTFAVTMVGACLGWRLGALSIAIWLLEGAAGLPVFANGAGGLHVFVGPTAGYLFSFPAAGALVGYLTERGANGRRPFFAFASMLAGNLVCLAAGFSWLCMFVGPSAAFWLGVAPFAVGTLLKSALGAVTLWGWAQRRPRMA